MHGAKLETRNSKCRVIARELAYTGRCIHTALYIREPDKMTTVVLSRGRRSVLPFARQKVTICGPNLRSFLPFAPQEVPIVFHSTQKSAIISGRNASISERNAGLFRRKAGIFARKAIVAQASCLSGQPGKAVLPAVALISGPYPPISRFFAIFLALRRIC